MITLGEKELIMTDQRAAMKEKLTDASLFLKADYRYALILSFNI